MNKAAIGGIIAAIIIGIGIAIAVTMPFEQTPTDQTSETTNEPQEAETKEFKIELKEDIGLKANP